MTEDTTEIVVESPEIQDDTQTEPQAVEQETQEKEPDPVSEKEAELEKLRKAYNRQVSKIGQKTAQIHAEREQRLKLEQELAQYRQKPPSQENAEDDVDRYVGSIAEKQARAILQEERQRAEQYAAQQQRTTEFRQRIETFKDRIPDIEEVLNTHRDVELPDHLIDAIGTLPEGPAIAAYAFKEGIMDDIADMSPAMAFMEIARIRDVINSYGRTAPVTKAPPPMKPVSGTSSSSKSISNMSADDLMKWLKS
jgi:hypothetical protein